MTDEMGTILREHLVFKDEGLKEWMLELLDFGQATTSLKQALDKLVPLSKELASSIDFRDKVPYCSLLLAFVYFRWDNYSSSDAWIQDALIRGFGNGSASQNHAVALWLHALAKEKSEHIDEAQHDIHDAIRLLQREVETCKRRGKWSEQKKYEHLIGRLQETGTRLNKEFRVHWVTS
jgi:hypothetical protein